MGGIGKTIGNIGKSLGGVLKTALPMAASFIPGPWGKLASMAGSLMGGSQQQGQANGYYQEAGGNASNIAKIQDQYYLPLLQNIMQQAGIGPDGKPIAGGQPYGQSDALASRYQDNAGQEAAKTVASAEHSLGGRGFNGANSISPALLAQIARNTTSDVASNNRQVGIDASNQGFQRLQAAMGALIPGSTSGLLAAAQPYQQQANASTAAAATNAGGIGDIGTSIFNQIFGHKGLFGQGGYQLTPKNTNQPVDGTPQPITAQPNNPALVA